MKSILADALPLAQTARADTAPQTQIAARKPGALTAARRLLVQQIALLLVILAVWEAAGAWLVDPFWSSRPSLIAERLWILAGTGDLWIHLSTTISEAGIGLAMGCGVGIALGLLMARFDRATRVAEPLFMGLYSLPRVALAPLFVLWFGIGLLAKVMMSFSMVVFVFVLNVLEGIRSLDRDPIDLLRTMRASPWYIARRVLLPAVLPWIAAAFRIAVGLSLIGAVVGELIGSSSGLGWYIEKSAGQLDTTGVFAGIISLLIVAMVANLLVTLVFRKLTGWRQ
ncbi:ABC transporter permease [Pigmentiphaga litoralis]|uniref:NitT/TauT family transport system permease protein n=1 Tax=Pigmentiphaga litoralis TaxID=516702 RepID=A0A7Y9IZW8_9BURK|nr:ABC transporter permease [Pigmentiphaga litoralis]NYE26343.1 NitT/TauT family transport system permease protein [Pigmentiphaga litoralis]NYE85463.1 NitT/TauT family transport system permease protein [Pigmentiphaga litoralis]